METLDQVIARVEAEAPGYEWLVRSNTGEGEPGGAMANLISRDGVMAEVSPGVVRCIRADRTFPAYGDTPATALLSSLAAFKASFQ